MSFAGAFTETIVDFAKGVARRGRIERLCSECGYSIAEREGQRYRIDFRDAVIGTRSVFVETGGDEGVMGFEAFSLSSPHATQIPEEIFAYLLMQNAKLNTCKWGVEFNDQKNAVFSLTYLILGDGLTSPFFQLVCEEMVKEAAGFDRRMNKAGLLR